ncbi:MAG: hypothetical protein RLZ55_734, partial [Actinomycetota bacterium]
AATTDAAKAVPKAAPNAAPTGKAAAL